MHLPHSNLQLAELSDLFQNTKSLPLSCKLRQVMYNGVLITFLISVTHMYSLYTKIHNRTYLKYLAHIVPFYATAYLLVLPKQ